MNKEGSRGAGGKARSVAGGRRQNSTRTYVVGNTVRQLSVVPIPRERPGSREERKAPRPDKLTKNHSTAPARRKGNPPKEQVRRERRRARQQVKELHLGFGSVIALGICAAMTMWICVGYLKLQAENTRSVKDIAALENELTDLITENDDAYNRLVSSIDLNSIRETAINELGMVYARSDQVVLYDSQTNDYVRQYREVPQEDASWLEKLLGSDR